MKIFENSLIYIEIEESEIPWLKIFTQKPYKEFSDCPKDVKYEIWRALDLIEIEMISYYKPTKINIASFGNYMPHVHFHIMARFEEDSYFPESMWGDKQRDSMLDIKNIQFFINILKSIL